VQKHKGLTAASREIRRRKRNGLGTSGTGSV